MNTRKAKKLFKKKKLEKLPIRVLRCRQIQKLIRAPKSNGFVVFSSRGGWIDRYYLNPQCSLDEFNETGHIIYERMFEFNGEPEWEGEHDGVDWYYTGRGESWHDENTCVRYILPQEMKLVLNNAKKYVEIETGISILK